MKAKANENGWKSASSLQSLLAKLWLMAGVTEENQAAESFSAARQPA